MSKYATPGVPFVDAQAALPFVVEQGRNIETRVYQKRYPPVEYQRHVPVVTEGNPWAFGTTFYKIDTSGKAKIISGAANDIPKNMATRDQASSDFWMIGSGWEWNMEEVNQASMLGVNLNDAKVMSANQSIETLLYDTAITGETLKNKKGLINSSDVSRVDAAGNGGENGGGGTSTFWKHKTPDEILGDVNELLGSIREATNEIEYGDTLRMPPEAFRWIATQRMGAGDGLITVLQYIRQNNIYTAETQQALDLGTIPELATASSDGGGRLMAYRRADEVVRFHLPMPKRGLGVYQASIMSFEDGLIARTGGTEWRIPAAAGYLDEITDVPS